MPVAKISINITLYSRLLFFVQFLIIEIYVNNPIKKTMRYQTQIFQYDLIML